MFVISFLTINAKGHTHPTPENYSHQMQQYLRNYYLKRESGICIFFYPLLLWCSQVDIHIYSDQLPVVLWNIPVSSTGSGLVPCQPGPPQNTQPTEAAAELTIINMRFRHYLHQPGTPTLLWSAGTHFPTISVCGMGKAQANSVKLSELLQSGPVRGTLSARALQEQLVMHSVERHSLFPEWTESRDWAGWCLQTAPARSSASGSLPPTLLAAAPAMAAGPLCLPGIRSAAPGAWRSLGLFPPSGGFLPSWPTQWSLGCCHWHGMYQTPQDSPLLLVVGRTVTEEPICHQQCTGDSPVRLPCLPHTLQHSKPPTGNLQPSKGARLQPQPPCVLVLPPGYTRPSGMEKFLLEPILRGVYINYEILSL